MQLEQLFVKKKYKEQLFLVSAHFEILFIEVTNSILLSHAHIEFAVCRTF